MGCYDHAYFRLTKDVAPETLVETLVSVLRAGDNSDWCLTRVRYREGSSWLEVASAACQDLECCSRAIPLAALSPDIVMLFLQTTVERIAYSHFVDGKLRRFLSAGETLEGGNAWRESFGVPELWEHEFFQGSAGGYVAGDESPFDRAAYHWLSEHYGLTEYWGGAPFLFDQAVTPDAWG